MLCERCKQNAASVQYTYTVNGNSVSYALCPQCYNQMSGAKAPLFSDFLFPMGNLSSVSSRNRMKKCDLCGYTIDRIHNEGMVGCARCYSTFREELTGFIARIHGNKQHVSGTASEDRQPTLEELLEKAIREENYEEAAILRDKIKAKREDKS